MKKKLTALFLAAVLSVSSAAAVIPVTAAETENEAEPIAVGTEFLGNAATTAVKVDVEDGNGYLHLYDRMPNRRHYNSTHTNLVTALGWQPYEGYTYLKTSAVYYVKLKARIANNWATQAEAQAANSALPEDATSMYFRMVAGSGFKIMDVWDTTIDGVTYESVGSSDKDKWDTNINITPIEYVGRRNFKPGYLNTKYYDEIVSERSNLSLTNNTYKAYSDGVSVALNNEWSTLVYAFMARWDNVVGSSGKQYFVAFSSVDGAYRNVPVDIDDFEVWYYDASGQKVTLASYDFDDLENPDHGYEYEPTNRYNKLFSVDGTSRSGYNKHFKGSNIVETDYYEVKVPQTGNTASGSIGYTLPADTVLDPGVYVFTADARLNFYDGYLDDTVQVNGEYPLQQYWQFIENEDNTARLDVKVNGESIGSCDVKSEWAPVTFTYTVPKGLNVTLESITADFTDDTYSVNKAFDLRNVKFTKTETFIPDSEFEDSEADVVYTVEDDAFVAFGAGNAKVEMTYPGSYIEGNKYLRVFGRAHERDGLILDLKRIVKNEPESTYRLRFKIRTGSELSNTGLTNKLGDTAETFVRLSAGEYQGKYATAAPVYFQKINGQYASYYQHTGKFWWQFSGDNNNHKESNGVYTTATWYDEDTNWRIIDVSFDDLIADNEYAGKRYNVIQIAGANSAIHTTDFDIDDIIIYDNKDGLKPGKDNYDASVDSIIWKEDFQGEDEGELGRKLSMTFVPFQDEWVPQASRPGVVDVEIEEDRPYMTAKGVNELKYTVPEYAGITLTPYIYTIRGSFSYPYFDGNRITAGVDPYKNRNVVLDNDNGFEATAVIETSNGTIQCKTVEIDNRWNDCEFKFRVDEQTELESITFVFTDASGAQTTTVCYRDVYLEGSAPASAEMPNFGIVMMLLIKKQAAIELEESLKEEALRKDEETDRALSDAEVVYPIIDSSFKSSDNDESNVKYEYTKSYEEGNKYLSVTGRFNNRDGLLLDMRRAVLDVSDDNYRLSFKIRTSVAASNLWLTAPGTAPYAPNDAIRLGEGIYNGAYSYASPIIFNNSDIVSSEGFIGRINGWYINNEWTTIDVSFKELKNMNVIHVGGGSEYLQASPLDIDDVMIYVPDEAEPVYVEDFQNEEIGKLSSVLSNFFIPFQNGNVPASYRADSVELNISQDSAYLTANDVSEIKYTVEDSSELALEAGEYTLHGSFSYPYFDGNRVTIGYTNDAKNQPYFSTNNNKLDVTAVVETENGVLTFDSYTVDNSWTDCEFTFNVEKDTVIKSISFKFTDGNGETVTTACYRNVYLDGNLAD